MTLEEYRALYADIEDAAPGWDALEGRLEEIYGEQVPKHWGTNIPYVLGGPDPESSPHRAT